MSNSSVENLDSIDGIIKILLDDSKLCNYAKYIDYGSYDPEWKSLLVKYPSELFHQTLIKFNKKINENSLKHFENTFMEQQRGFSKYYKKHIINIDSSNSSNDVYKKIPDVFKDALQEISVNINSDMNLKIKSMSYLDFYDNIVSTKYDDKYCNSVLNSIFNVKELTNLFSRADMLIFVGNRSNLLAIIWDNHYIDIDFSVLLKIKNAYPTQYADTIYRLFSIFDMFCVYFMKTNMTQFIKNKIQNCFTQDLMDNISNYLNDKGINNYVNINDIKLDNKKALNTIKKKYDDILTECISDILNKKYEIDGIDYPHLIKVMRENYEKQIKNLKSIIIYKMTTITSVCKNFGWEPIIDSDGKMIIKKELSYIPNVAVIDGVTYILNNQQYIDFLQSDCDVFVNTLYLDIEKGELYVDKNTFHPNVASNSMNGKEYCKKVCMGDLAHTINILDLNSADEIGAKLTACENLLHVCNYDSAYNSYGKRIFQEYGVINNVEKSYDNKDNEVKEQDGLEIIDGDLDEDLQDV